MKFLSLLLFTLSLYSSVLNLAISSNPARLNPLLATDSASSEITGFLFNSLVKYDDNSSVIVGDLAKKFYFKDDVTLVFELKKGIKWHDGVEFSSKDVLFTYKTIISKDVITPYSSSFRYVKDIELVDRYKLIVHFKQPYFKALETFMIGIIPEHILKDEKDIMNSSFNKHPIGTGPYKLTKLEFSKNIELKAFDDYFEGKPKIEKISLHVIADTTTRFLMLKSGELDIGSIEPLVYEREITQNFLNKFNIYKNITFSYTYLGFNLRKQKFKNPKIREALSLAINRQELIDILFFQHAKVCKGPFLETSKGYNPLVKPPKQDIQKAKKLLKELGYDENNHFRFEIVTSNSNTIRPYAVEILQHQLKKIDVDVKIRIMEWQAFLNTVVFPHNFDAVLLGWGLSKTPDPYMIWHSDNDKPGGFNFIGYHNKKLDKLIEKSQKTVDRKKLYKMWQEMFKIIVDDNPYLFLYTPNSITAVNKDIKNITPTPNGIWYNYINWEK